MNYATVELSLDFFYSSFHVYKQILLQSVSEVYLLYRAFILLDAEHALD